jgi:hypothetical protein
LTYVVVNFDLSDIELELLFSFLAVSSHNIMFRMFIKRKRAGQREKKDEGVDDAS